MDLGEILEMHSTNDILNQIDPDDLISFVVNNFEREIIDEIDEYDLIRYGLPNHLVFSDEDDLIEYVKDNDIIEMTELEENKKLQSFRKTDVINLINDITIRHGWDVVYDILEREKINLNIP